MESAPFTERSLILVDAHIVKVMVIVKALGGNDTLLAKSNTTFISI